MSKYKVSVEATLAPLPAGVILRKRSEVPPRYRYTLTRSVKGGPPGVVISTDDWNLVVEQAKHTNDSLASHVPESDFEVMIIDNGDPDKCVGL